jgi:DNA-binding GntR family transcriptional regulator
MAKATYNGRSSPIKTTLTEQTYEILKERILDRGLAPGTRLNIDALTRDLGVSTSPLREALSKLEAERLVISELYSGYSVAPEPTLDYLRDLIDFRTMLEGHCALVGAPRKAASVLNELRAAIRQMGAAKQIGTHYKQYKKFVAADQRFHQVIVESAGNQVISDTYRGMNAILLQARLYLYRSGGRARAGEVAEEHARILRAFEAGDGPEAALAIREHLEGGKRRLLSGDEASAQAGSAEAGGAQKPAVRERPRRTLDRAP